MVKILIEIKGGTLQYVASTEPIEYILVDHDNLWIDPQSPDFTPQDEIKTGTEMFEYGISISNNYLQ